MIKPFHEDILFAESLKTGYQLAIKTTKSTEATDEFLVKTTEEYIEERFDPERRKIAIQLLRQICLNEHTSALKELQQNRREDRADKATSSLTRIIIRLLITEGQIVDYLELAKGNSKYFLNQEIAIAIEDINCNLEVQESNNGVIALSRENLKIMINIKQAYAEFLLGRETLKEKTLEVGEKERVLQIEYLNKIMNIINGKEESFERLTIKKRIRDLFNGNIKRQRTVESQDQKIYKIAVCTHHKCGTAFLMKIIKEISRIKNFKVWRKYYEPTRHTDNRWDLVFEQHSRIQDIDEPLKGIHCIRRPEALIYSATLYHQKATEAWLDIPLDKFDHNTFRAFTTGKIYNLINDNRIEAWRKEEIVANYQCDQKIDYRFEADYDFKGRTYREMLKSFATFDDKLKFEMQCYSRGVISDMLNFDVKDFFVLKLEDASLNPNMEELREAFIYIGIEGDELDECMNACKEDILVHNPQATGKHGTTNLSNEWEHAYTGKLKEFYRAIYGDSAELMGYK